MTLGFDFEKFRTLLESFGAAPIRNVVVHSVIDSTSNDLKRRLENGAPPGTLVAARQQTAGRGRSGREWVSEAVGNLYLSISLDVADRSLENVPLVPLAAGIAAWEAVRDACDVLPELKWPNDVLVNGRKLAGILTELISVGNSRPVVVVGIGVNTGTPSFPPALRDIAVSVPMLTGETADPSAVAARFVYELGSWIQRIGNGERADLVAAWRERAEPFGRRVRVGEIEGMTRDLTPDGRLLIVKNDGVVVEVVGGIVESIYD